MKNSNELKHVKSCEKQETPIEAINAAWQLKPSMLHATFFMIGTKAYYKYHNTTL